MCVCVCDSFIFNFSMSWILSLLHNKKVKKYFEKSIS